MPATTGGLVEERLLFSSLNDRRLYNNIIQTIHSLAAIGKVEGGGGMSSTVNEIIIFFRL